MQCSEHQYLDSGCSTHMSRRKDWFVTINCAMKNKVNIADDITIVMERINDVSAERRDG